MREDLYRDLYEQEKIHWWHRAKRLLCVSLITRYRPQRALKLLDVGCGTGANMEALHRFGDVWGVDQSKTAVSYCLRRHLKHVRVGNAEQLHFSDGQFDVITVLDLLEHTDDVRVLSHMYRMLTKGGIAVVTVPAYPWLFSRWDEVLRHKRRYGREELLQKVRATGFMPVKFSCMYSFALLPAMVTRIVKSAVYTKETYPSDFHVGYFLNSFFYLCASIERFFIANLGVSIPFGIGFVVVAKK